MTEPIYVPYYMADVFRASAQRKFTVASTFGGGGGSSLGNLLAGGRVLLAIDHSAEAVRTYRANFTNTLVVQGDIRRIAATRDATLAVFERAGIKPGELDILDGSPPCNEFSRLGPGITVGGTADLIFDFVRMAKWMMPRVVIIENVPELAGRYRDILENALDELRFGDHGERVYFPAYQKLIASEYGVPQKRKRLIVIAGRADVATAAGITTDAGLDRVFPQVTTPVPLTVRSALTGLEQSEADKAPWFRTLMTSPLARIAPILVRDPEKWIKPKWIKPRDINLGSEGRYTLVRSEWDLPSPTLTAFAQRPDGLCGVLHPTEHRKFSIPELKRVHGFPDDYIFTGTLAQAAERMGNAVPPLLMKAIAESIYEKALQPFHQTFANWTSPSPSARDANRASHPR
jgi:site-specific DNA-cytosine methylase